MKKILLVRHAQSVTNAGDVSENTKNVELTDRGHQQAKHLVNICDKPELFITSPYVRTQQTSAFLRNKMPEVSHEEWDEVKEFTFLSESNWRNSSKADRKPFVDVFWEKADPEYCDGGGAESFSTFMCRIQTFLQKLKERSENIITVFTHGQFMKAVLWQIITNYTYPASSDAMKATDKFLQSIIMPNTGIIEMNYDKDRWYLSLKYDHIIDWTY